MGKQFTDGGTVPRSPAWGENTAEKGSFQPRPYNPQSGGFPLPHSPYSRRTLGAVMAEEAVLGPEALSSPGIVRHGRRTQLASLLLSGWQLPSNHLNPCCGVVSHVPSVRPACATPPQLSTQQLSGAPSGPLTLQQPGKVLPHWFSLSLGLAGVCQSASHLSVGQQMSVEGRARFWVMEVQCRMRQTSCAQGDCPHRRGGGVGRV